MTYLHSITQGPTLDSSDQSDSRWWPGPRVARFLLGAVWQYCYWQCRAVSHSFIFTRPSQLRPSTIKWEWGRTKGDKLYCSAMFRHSCDVTLLPSWRDSWFKYMLDLYTADECLSTFSPSSWWASGPNRPLWQVHCCCLLWPISAAVWGLGY